MSLFLPPAEKPEQALKKQPVVYTGRAVSFNNQLPVSVSNPCLMPFSIGETPFSIHEGIGASIR